MDADEEMTEAAIAQRFGAPIASIAAADRPRAWPRAWRDLAGRGSCRAFTKRRVAPELIETLCALALAAPSKSDLQQRDIVIVDDAQIRGRIDALLAHGGNAQAWIPGAPVLLVFCGNNRRQRQLHAWRGKPFANDHLDAFFNATVDAGIALAQFVVAAEAAGLGCAPISAIRNHAEDVSGLLDLPEHVFPVAGLGLGLARARAAHQFAPAAGGDRAPQPLRGNANPPSGRRLRPPPPPGAANPLPARPRKLRRS
jgi:nitroreductase/FMN reductase [NAD(P)H]